VALALSRRLSQDHDAGPAPYQQAQAWLGAVSGKMEVAIASVNGDAKRWEEMLVSIAGDVGAAARNGLLPDELQIARKELLAELDTQTRQVNQFPAERFVRSLTEAVTTRAVPISNEQKAILAHRLVPTLSDTWINTELACRFDPAGATLLLLLPETYGQIDTEQAKMILSAALDQPASQEVRLDAQAQPICERPAPGKIDSIELDPTTATTSAWLGNGVRFHHVELNTAPNEVAIAVCLAGGQIEETTATRGLTQASIVVFQNPATKDRPASALQLALRGTSIQLGSALGENSVGLSIRCTKDDLEPAMQLLHVLLTTPLIEPRSVQRWAWMELKRRQLRERTPEYRALELLQSVTSPADDARRHPLTDSALNGISVDAVQGWIDRLVSSAPIEVAMVGDIKREHALELAADYIATLAPRPRINASAFCELRDAANLDPIGIHQVQLPAQSAGAATLIAIRGPDTTDINSSVTMDIAARILENRINVACTQRRQLARRTQVRHMPANAYPGSGVLYALAQTDAPLLDALSDEINRQFDAFRQRGPSPAELDLARTQALATLQQITNDPGALAQELCQLALKGQSPRDIQRQRELLAAVTPESVMRTFARFDLTPQNRLQLHAEPKPSPANAPPTIPVVHER